MARLSAPSSALSLGTRWVWEQSRGSTEARLELGPENINWVGTEETDRTGLQQLVPQLFEADRCGALTANPQQTYHLTVSPYSGVHRARLDSV